MGKPRKGEKRDKKVSKGSMNSMRKLVFSETPLERMTRWVSAWKRGQNPTLTISNPNREETNKPFIRVKANDYWGKYWFQGYLMNNKEVS